MSKMKKVYQNKWAGYDCYFIPIYYIKDKNGGYLGGISIHNAYGDWEVGNSKFHASQLKNDTEHFPVVAKIDLDSIIIKEILDLIKEEKNV